MKKLSCILLAVMLITALFVSCKAEVIDDSNLVSVHFTTDDNAKGLNWSRPAFDSSDYYWTYYAKKVGGGPATGEGSGTIGADLTKEIGPFSQGAWEFTLYGYSNESKKTLVYEGTGSGVLSREKNNSVKVAVEAKKEGEGTIHVSKDIVLKYSNGVSYVPTGIIVKQVGSETVVREAEFNSANGNDIYGLKSDYYAVTIQMVATVNGEEIVYASNTIYVNVYDGQTTTIGGTLDESTTSTKFEAEDGTISDNKEGEVNEDGSASFTVDVSPSNVESDKTIVEFPKGALEASKTAKLSVAAYPTSVITKTFGVSKDDAAPIFGIDLQLTVDGAEVKEFNGKAVTITTFVAKNLTSSVVESQDDAEAEGLKVVYNGGGDQPAIVSYDPANGKLVFTTTHFSQYYVASTKIVAVNTTTNAAYTSLQDAVDEAENGATVVLIANVDTSAMIKIKTGITLDFNDKKITNTKDIWKDSENCVVSVEVPEGQTVVFKGNGTISAKKDDCYAVDIKTGCLSIEDGSYIGNVSVVQVQKGTLEILGGHFELLQTWDEGEKPDLYPKEEWGCRYTINCIDGDYKDGLAKVSIKGGEFVYFDPSDSISENPRADFVADGYVSEKNGNIYTVRKKTNSDAATIGGTLYESLSAAIAGALDGETIRLLNDIDLQNQEIVVNGKSLTINGNGKKVTYSGNNAAFEMVGNGYNICFLNVSIDSVNGGIWDFGTNGTLEIKNSDIIGNNWFALYHNGSYEGFKCKAVDSSFTSDTSAGIYISGSTKTSEAAGRNQKLELEGCNVTGSTGIEGKYTDMTLTNCTVTALAEAPVFEQYNNGTTTDGFAVVSTDNSMRPDSPKPTAKIIISGGTYKGLIGLASLVNTSQYPDFTEAEYIYENNPSVTN